MISSADLAVRGHAGMHAPTICSLAVFTTWRWLSVALNLVEGVR